MSRVRAPRPHRSAALALALCIASTGMVSLAPARNGSIAFAAPGIKKVAAVRPRDAGAPDVIAAKSSKRLKVAASPAKRGGVGAAKPRAEAPRPYRPDAEPLADGPVVVNGNGYLALPVYTGLRNDAIAVMTQLPPDKHFYIGVGRSPTALVTLLSLLLPDGAVSFPSSGLSRGIAPQHVAEFDRHIDALIPPEAFSSGKTIVLMDTVSGGGSLRAMRDRLAAYSLAKYGRPASIALLGLGGTADGITHFIKSTAFLQAGKDEIAPYLGEHQIGRDTLERLPGKQNPGHADFRSALAQRMARDGALDSFLEEGYRRVTRLSPSMKEVGVILTNGTAHMGVNKVEDFKSILAGEIASQNIETKRAGEQVRIRVLYNTARKRSTVESNLATLPPGFTRHLNKLLYDQPGGLPFDLHIRATLDAKGVVADPNSIIVTRRVRRAKPPGRLDPLGPPVSISLHGASVGQDPIVHAQLAVISLLRRVPWHAAHGDKFRLELKPTREGVVVTSNVAAHYIPSVLNPGYIQLFGPLMAGPANGMGQAIEIEATFDKDGRVSTRDAVIIRRLDVAGSSK